MTKGPKANNRAGEEESLFIIHAVVSRRHHARSIQTHASSVSGCLRATSAERPTTSATASTTKTMFSIKNFQAALRNCGRNPTRRAPQSQQSAEM